MNVGSVRMKLIIKVRMKLIIKVSQASCNFEHVAYNVALVTLYIAQPFNTSPTGGH